MLGLYHNGPCWGRILGLDATITYEEALREMLKKKERKEAEAMKKEKSQETMEIMKLIREGVKPKDIAAQMNCTVQHVYDATSRARAKGELPQAQPKKLINRAPHNAPKQAATPQEAQAPAPKFSSSSGTACPAEPTAQEKAEEPAKIATNTLMGEDEAAAILKGIAPVGLPAPPLGGRCLAPAPDFSRLHEMIDLCARLPELTAGLLKSCDEIETAARYQLALVAEIRGKLSA